MRVVTKMTIKASEAEKEILWSFSEALTEACDKSEDCADCPYYKFRNEHDPCPMEDHVFADVLRAFLD